VQILWLNVIDDSVAALALATDPPESQLLDRKPHSRHESIVTPNMIKHIIF